MRISTVLCALALAGCAGPSPGDFVALSNAPSQDGAPTWLRMDGAAIARTRSLEAALKAAKDECRAHGSAPSEAAVDSMQRHGYFPAP
jgi:hypothetical protein